MPELLLYGGQRANVPSLAEISAEVSRQERERARGVKAIRVSGIGTQPAAQTLYIPNGPASGYIWTLRLLSVQISAADTCIAYIASSAPSAGATPQRLITPFGTSNANQYDKFAKGQVMLYADESVYLSCSAHTINAWFMTAWEVPSEMEYKLV